MSCPGDWINFEELCRRVPGKSASTLRRYIAAKLISKRQLVRGGRIEFNWRTVERELRALETPGVNAHLAEVVDLAPAGDAELRRELAEQRTLLEAIAGKLGVSLIRAKGTAA